MCTEYEKHVPSRLELLVGMAADAWRRWRDCHDFAAFAAANPDEAARLAQDMGTDTQGLVRIAGSGREWPQLLGRRLRLMGIDPESLKRREPATARDLSRCCALCDSKSVCARDLAQNPWSRDWEKYCVNHQTIDALAAESRTPAAAAH